MSSTFICLVVSGLCSLTNHWWCNLLAVVGDHPVRLPIVFALLFYNLGCLSLSVWYQHSVACQVFLHLSFPCGFVWRASLQWTDLIQVCIWFWLCIGVVWEEFVVFSAIALWNLSSRLLLVVCDLYHTHLSCKPVVMEFLKYIKYT